MKGLMSIVSSAILLCGTAQNAAYAVTLIPDDGGSTAQNGAELRTHAGALANSKQWSSTDVLVSTTLECNQLYWFPSGGDYVHDSEAQTKCELGRTELIVPVSAIKGSLATLTESLSCGGGVSYGSGFSDLQYSCNVTRRWTISASEAGESAHTTVNCTLVPQLQVLPVAPYTSGSVEITNLRFGVGSKSWGPYRATLNLVTGQINGTVPNISSSAGTLNGSGSFGSAVAVGGSVWVSWEVAVRAYSTVVATNPNIIDPSNLATILGFSVTAVPGGSGPPEQPKSLNVTFDPQGGAVAPTTKSVVKGSVYGALPTPERAGFTFVGWYSGANGKGEPITATTVVNANGDHKLYAKWEVVYLASNSYEATMGALFSCTLAEAYAHAGKVKMSGRPSWLKYNAAANSLSGVATKEGHYEIIVSEPGVGTQKVVINVTALPGWAVGTFNGYADDGTRHGPATMTVTAKGKISGKWSLAATNWSFSAASYTARQGLDVFRLEATAKAGKMTLPLTLTVTPAAGEIDSPLGVATADLTDGATTLSMYRNIWTPTTIAPYVGYYTATLSGNGEYGSGYMTVTVNNKGGIKIAGKLGDGVALAQAATLVSDSEECVWSALYTAPRTYGGGTLSGLIELIPQQSEAKPMALRGLNGYDMHWESFNPSATEVYGAGFVRALPVAGGRYSTLETLFNDYADGVTISVTEPPELVANIRYSDFDPDSESERPPKVSWNETEEISHAGPTPSGLPLLWRGTTLVAPPVDKPRKGEEPGEYLYEDINDDGIDNSCALIYKLNARTGLFSGSFAFYFDYISAMDYTRDEGGEKWTHATKKVTYQGVLTPVQEDVGIDTVGRGYFLWPDVAVYETGGVDRNGDPAVKSYKYKASCDFMIAP